MQFVKNNMMVTSKTNLSFVITVARKLHMFTVSNQLMTLGQLLDLQEFLKMKMKFNSCVLTVKKDLMMKPVKILSFILNCSQLLILTQHLNLISCLFTQQDQSEWILMLNHGFQEDQMQWTSMLDLGNHITTEIL